MGDKRRAKQQLRKALHLRERDYELRMKLAEIYLQDGEYGDARGEYVYVSEHGPDHLKPEAFFGAGKACMKEEKYERAEMYTAKAVELKGDEKRYRTQLSTIYEKQGKFKEAAEVMSPVEDQTDANEYLTLGVKHEKAGKLEKAAEFYEKGIASDPGKGIFYLKLGLIRARIEDGKEPDERDYTSAMGIYEKAFDNDLHDVPEMPKIAYNLGRLYQQYPEAGSEEASRKALGCYWQAIRKDPLMIKAYFTAAGAYIGTKPWNSTMHIAVWSAVLITLAGLYFVRRRRIKKKLAQQTSGKGDSE
jgi:tetratricopeptide (TPR) repeat protein